MSYCRIDDDSDVYVYSTLENDEAVWKTHISYEIDHLYKGIILTSPSLNMTISQLQTLRGMGIKVPQDAIDRLTEEWKENSMYK